MPLTASDDDGDPLTFKVTSSKPIIMARVKTGNPVLHLSVSYGSGQTGEMYLQLFREWTPITTGFISGFAQAGFFDGLKFHRVVKDFVIQGGDPLGTGGGGPGMTGGNAATSFKYDNEAQPGLIFSGRGQLAMANADPTYSGGSGTGYPAGFRFGGTTGSQFFITQGQPRSLDFKHTIFGQLLRGWETLAALNNVTTVLNPSGTEVSAPSPAVTITSATIEADNHDAVLLLSSTAIGSAVITVTVDDGHGGIATETFTANSVADDTNDPPVVVNQAPQVTPEGTQLNFPIRVFDLESDYVSLKHFGLDNGVLTSTGGPIGKVSGNAGFSGLVRLGFDARQYGTSYAQYDAPVTRAYADVGVGDLPLRAEANTIKSTPGASFSGSVARFKDLDTAGAAANFTAQINWGDGTPVQTGNFVRDTSVPGPANYTVTGSHTFPQSGFYTIIVTAKGTKGAVAVARSTAIVSSASLIALGQQLDVKGASVANRILATFTDSNPAGRAIDYTALVDWGDGAVAKGLVSRVAPGSFVVRGAHTYKDAEPFSISVRIQRAGAADALAWSLADVTGFTPPAHLPPFPVAHLLPVWTSGLGKRIIGFAQNSLANLIVQAEGNLEIFNCGTRAAAASKLRYFLSSAPVQISGFTSTSDTSVPTVVTTVGNHGLTSGEEVVISDVAGGTFLGTINGYWQVNVVSPTQFSVPVACTNSSVTARGRCTRTTLRAGDLPLGDVPLPGFAANQDQQMLRKVALPKGEAGAGKRIYAQLLYADPILDGVPVDRLALSGPLKAQVILYDLQSELGFFQTGEAATDENGKKVTFSMVLDTQPTADVTIAVQSSTPTEGIVQPTSITFNSSNWNQPRLVTITGVADATHDGIRAYQVTVKAPTTTDPNYTGLSDTTLALANIDR